MAFLLSPKTGGFPSYDFISATNPVSINDSEPKIYGGPDAPTGTVHPGDVITGQGGGGNFDYFRDDTAEGTVRRVQVASLPYTIEEVPGAIGVEWIPTES